MGVEGRGVRVRVRLLGVGGAELVAVVGGGRRKPVQGGRPEEPGTGAPRPACRWETHGEGMAGHRNAMTVELEGRNASGCMQVGVR